MGDWLNEILTSLFTVVIFFLCTKSEGDSRILYESSAACILLAFSEGWEVSWVLFTASVGDSVLHPVVDNAVSIWEDVLWFPELDSKLSFNLAILGKLSFTF